MTLENPSQETVLTDSLEVDPTEEPSVGGAKTVSLPPPHPDKYAPDVGASFWRV